MQTRTATDVEVRNFKRLGIALRPIVECKSEKIVGYQIPIQKCWVKRLLKKAIGSRYLCMFNTDISKSEIRRLAVKSAKKRKLNNIKLIKEGASYRIDAW